jgi:hypothetical protein
LIVIVLLISEEAEGTSGGWLMGEPPAPNAHRPSALMRFLALPILTAFCLFVPHLPVHGAPVGEPIDSVGSAKPLSLEDRLNGKTQWDMASGERLWLLFADQGTKLMDGRANVVWEISAPETVHQVVVSRDATCLLLRVMRERSGASSDYSCLLRITRKPQSPWLAQRVLTSDTPPMKEFLWIAQIRAISNTGRMALLKFGEVDPRTSQLTFSWQTWLLDPPCKIADGTRVPADFDKR